jgi:hypothetical protein
VLLILLGLWGGLAPFVGPYFHFGFAPDKTWDYSSIRLYYSIIPGAVALLAGVLVLATRNRALGMFGGVVAALAGLWFGLGEGFVTVVLRRPSLALGAQIAPAGQTIGSGSVRAYLEMITFFGGLGLVIVFCAAIAVGRFSLVAATDLVAEEEDEGEYANVTAVSQPAQFSSAGDPFRTSPSPFPPTESTT